MAAILFGLLAGAATLLGMWLVLRHEVWARRHAVYLVAFAIGVLLSAAFTEIIPEAFEFSPAAPFVVLATFAVFYVLEHSIVAHHHVLHGDHEDTHVPVEKLAFAGLTVHSLVDGLAIGAGFEVSAALGLLATLAVILHEIPEGILTVALFLHAGYPRRRAVAWSTIVALATPLGAIAMVLLPGALSPAALGALLAVAGGSFLYVAAADLIPETHHARHVPAIFLVLAGMLLPFMVGQLVG